MKAGEAVRSAPRVKEEKINAIFSYIANHYDMINSLISLNQHLKWVRFAVSKMDLKTGEKALDVCCGTGTFAIEMAREVGAGGQVTGLDFCEDMLKIAENKIQREQCTMVTLLKGNAMMLPFGDNEFDGAAIGFALRNVLSIEKVLLEMHRVVKPGGAAVALEIAKPTAPIFKEIFYLYFSYLVPLIGRIGVGSSGKYDWLPESLKDYPPPIKIKEKFYNAGFREVFIYRLALGVITVHVGKK